MLDFLTENWKIITILGCIIIEAFILVFTKKRPQIVDNSFVYYLCLWISQAESKFVSGEDKMKFVLEKAKEKFGDYYDEVSTVKMVEYLLTLPQKKGVNKK